MGLVKKRFLSEILKQSVTGIPFGQIFVNFYKYFINCPACGMVKNEGFRKRH